jgi:hypothetical protein
VVAALASPADLLMPLPQLLPSVSAFTTCTINCDTQAMKCQSSCVVVGPVATTPNSAGAAPCNLSCTSRLVCKHPAVWVSSPCPSLSKNAIAAHSGEAIYLLKLGPIRTAPRAAERGRGG